MDFYLRELNRVIEADGCYWHGCKKCGCPDRFRRAAADAKKVKRLEDLGFKVLRLKECEMKNGSATKIIKGFTRVARWQKAAGKAAGAAGKAAAKAGKGAGKVGGTFAGTFAQGLAAAAAGILVDVLVEMAEEHFSHKKGDEPPPDKGGQPPPETPGCPSSGNAGGPRPPSSGRAAGPDVYGPGFSGKPEDWS